MQIEEARFSRCQSGRTKAVRVCGKSPLWSADLWKIFRRRDNPTASPRMKKARAMLRLAQQKGNHRFEWQYLDSKHEPFWCEVLITAIPIDHGPLLYAVVRDISKRKSDQQSLHLAAQVFQNSREAILIADRHRRIMSVNEAFTDITGFRPDEVIGKAPPMLRTGLHDPKFLPHHLGPAHGQRSLARRIAGNAQGRTGVSAVAVDHGGAQSPASGL
ncbi:PAS domain-containing protein [Undibacterium arcticum]